MTAGDTKRGAEQNSRDHRVSTLEEYRERLDGIQGRDEVPRLPREAVSPPAPARTPAGETRRPCVPPRAHRCRFPHSPRQEALTDGAEAAAGQAACRTACREQGSRTSRFLPPGQKRPSGQRSVSTGHRHQQLMERRTSKRVRSKNDVLSRDARTPRPRVLCRGMGRGTPGDRRACRDRSPPAPVTSGSRNESALAEGLELRRDVSPRSRPLGGPP